MGYRSAYRSARRPAYPGSNAAHYPADATALPLPPGTPDLWYDAQDVNGDGTPVTNGAAVGTWVNKGSVGVGANLVQAVAGNKPTFRLVASAGKFNNLSGVEFDNVDDFIGSAAFTALAQPNLILCVLLPVDDASGNVVYDGAGVERHQLTISGGTDILSMYAGGFGGGGTFAVTLANYTLITWSGATSVPRINGTAQPATDPGTQSLGGFILGANTTPTPTYGGHIIEVIVWNGVLPSVADVNTYVNAKFGASWPH